jgi:hypothetical protein
MLSIHLPVLPHPPLPLGLDCISRHLAKHPRNLPHPLEPMINIHCDGESTHPGNRINSTVQSRRRQMETELLAQLVSKLREVPGRGQISFKQPSGKKLIIPPPPHQIAIPGASGSHWVRPIEERQNVGLPPGAVGREKEQGLA